MFEKQGIQLLIFNVKRIKRGRVGERGEHSNLIHYCPKSQLGEGESEIGKERDGEGERERGRE